MYLIGNNSHHSSLIPTNNASRDHFENVLEPTLLPPSSHQEEAAAAAAAAAAAGGGGSSPPPLSPAMNTKEKAEFFYYILILCFGLPTNLFAFRKMVRKFFEFSDRKRRPSKSLGLILLTLQLSASDLMVLLIYVPTQIMWKYTVVWTAGDVLCKILRFFHQLSFHLSSFTVVSIATERVFTVARPYRPKWRLKSVKIMIMFTWVFSVVCSCKSLVMWHVFTPFPVQAPEFIQCTTLFVSSMYKLNTEHRQKMDQLMNLTFAQHLKEEARMRNTMNTNVTLSSRMAQGQRQQGHNETMLNYISSEAAKVLGGNTLNSTGIESTSQERIHHLEERIQALNGSIHRLLETQDSYSFWFGVNNIVGILTIFWIPAVYLVIAYTYIYLRLKQFANAPPIKHGPLSINYYNTGNSSQTDNSRSTIVYQNLNGSKGSMVAYSTTNSSPVANSGGPPQTNWRKTLQSKQFLFGQTGLLVLIYFICWIPYFMVSFMHRDFHVFVVLIGLNSAVNPIVYAFD